MPLSRRRFLVLLSLTLVPRPARAARMSTPRHPTPRRGITAAAVLADDALEERAAAPVFAMVRTMPAVADGIRCNCGCAELSGIYSLLSCFERDGMAQHCVICQGQARLAYQLHRKGRSLRDIRAAIDREFGD